VPTNPAVRAAIAALTESMAALADDTLDALTAAARDAIPKADFAGITIVELDGRITILAPTDPVVEKVVELQQEFREGPSFEPVSEHGMVIAESLPDDQRWPSDGPAAGQVGIQAQLSVDLHRPDKRRASLDLYSRERWVFTSALEDAELFASHASIVLGYAHATDHFESALSSRKTIGLALGILMERYDLDEDRAFSFLVRVSQDSNIKLREVAADIVAATNVQHDASH
jgi:hypothetical protein